LKGETLEREESVKFPNEAAPSFNEMVGLIANVSPRHYTTIVLL
jgi:hypothetical protein